MINFIFLSVKNNFGCNFEDNFGNSGDLAEN